MLSLVVEFLRSVGWAWRERLVKKESQSNTAKQHRKDRFISCSLYIDFSKRQQKDLALFLGIAVVCNNFELGFVCPHRLRRRLSNEILFSVIQGGKARGKLALLAKVLTLMLLRRREGIRASLQEHLLLATKQGFTGDLKKNRTL